jgi:predicted Zn-dependent protease
MDLLIPALLFSSCKTTPSPVETPLFISPPSFQENPVLSRPPGGGTADEIRSLVEQGSPSSLRRVLDLLQSQNLAEGDFGRMMNAVAVTVLQKLYPGVQITLPPADPPRVHRYTRILEEAALGNYTIPPDNSQDYLEHILPFLAYLEETQAGLLLSALPDLERARALNPQGVLARYFTGMVYERTGERDKAAAEFVDAYGMSRECYPAAIALARIMNAEGRDQEGLRLLSDLVIQYPDNIVIKRQLALAYYNSRDWSRAEPAIAELLQRDSKDGQFILMRAYIMVDRGQFLQAQVPLDLYAAMDTNNRLYLFLRARVQAEGYRNRDGALNYLRSLLRSYPDDEEAMVYTAELLMESGRSGDQAEGRELLERLLNFGESSLKVITLALQDAVHRQAWKDALPYLNRLLADRRSTQDLLLAYKVEQGLGNNPAALAYARELYELDPTLEEGAIAYISALIDMGQQSEAARMLESRISGLSRGILKSRYYYLRSRLQTNEESRMEDLRSSLFEDPRNLNALIRMFEIYHRRKDERRAVYYLKQALALAPDDPQLNAYRIEYEPALRN